MNVEITKIKVAKRIRTDDGDIAELAENIKAHGLLAPVIVHRTDTGYKLLAGKRRLAACRMLGHSNIDVRIVKKP